MVSSGGTGFEFAGLVTNTFATNPTPIVFASPTINVIHTDVVATVEDNGPSSSTCRSPNSPTGGDVVSVVATLADGKPLPSRLSQVAR